MHVGTALPRAIATGSLGYYIWGKLCGWEQWGQCRASLKPGVKGPARLWEVAREVLHAHNCCPQVRQNHSRVGGQGLNWLERSLQTSHLTVEQNCLAPPEALCSEAPFHHKHSERSGFVLPNRISVRHCAPGPSLLSRSECLWLLPENTMILLLSADDEYP